MTTSPVPHAKFHVALLLETSREVGRGLLRGVRRYARLHGPWGLHVMPGDLIQTLPTMRAWGGTGIIARVPTDSVARAILRTGLPVIAGPLSDRQLAPSSPLSGCPEIRANGEAIGRLAAEHLMDRGLAHFAFVGGYRTTNWVERRQSAFATRLKEAGFPCAIYPKPPTSEQDWGREQKRLVRWLAAQPKPLGVMAALDARGRQVIEACMEAGLSVPDEVAVIGVDNDELLCELCDPPLSSVALNAEKAGYEAAELLEAMMRGQKAPPRQILIEPTHVVARQSTEIAATDDRKIADALRFIRHEANRPLGIPDVAEHIGLSRRSLELRFRRALGHTVLTEIRRSQLERVRAFLIETDWPIGKIAQHCGFSNGNYLGKIFRKEFEETPQSFRLRQK
ncbi:MAG: XylR family transcriptional regulator [Chthoniobacteraceae bacterium]